MKTFLSTTLLGLLAAPALAFAQDAAPAATDVMKPVLAIGPAIASWGLVFAFAGAALGTILPCIGSILGVSMVGQAGSGLLTEKPELMGKVITIVVLPGSQGLYGMVISLLFFFNYGPMLTETLLISTFDGLLLFTAFLPVMFTGLTSAPYQAKVCTAGMQMLARDGKLAGRVITLAALVETYALLGFLISFFMLNLFKAAIIG